MGPTDQSIAIPPKVSSYLLLHHIITIGTSAFTGMPHAATTAYASGPLGVYFSMRPEELTLRNIEANHWASFTIDDYTPDFRKVRELRGVGRCGPVLDVAEQADAVHLFEEKFPMRSAEALTNLYRISPLVLDFVDFEYSAGVAVPLESSIVYEAAPEAARGEGASGISTTLETRVLRPGEVIVRQGERSNRFFIIVSGEVEVRKEGHGQDVIVTRHGPGQLFGEAGALTGAPQSATFVAARETTVLAIDRSSFQDFVSQSADAELRQRVRAALTARGDAVGEETAAPSDFGPDADLVVAATVPSTAEAPRLPPEGWYPDPAGAATHRYWDGSHWTEQTR